MKTILFSILLAVNLSAASISSISCAGGVATVTVANSLIANQGFEITGTSVSAYNINGTAVSANTTSFTFKITCAGSATGGTFLPAVQILNTGVVPNNSGATVNYILWLTTINPTPCPACSSNYAGINAAQLAALQAGTTVEAVGSFGITNGETSAQMNTAILAIYTAAQSTVSQGLSQYVGWCYNGLSWVATCN